MKSCPILTSDIPVAVPETLSLDAYLGTGRQQDEQELDIEVAAFSEPEFNAVAMSQLEAMGFPTIRCQKALLATGNSDAETAMTWLFEHMEDPDIDSPLPAAGSAAAGNEPSADQIAMIADMGFTPAQARKALRETVRRPGWHSSTRRANDRTATPSSPSNGFSPILGTAARKHQQHRPAARQTMPPTLS